MKLKNKKTGEIATLTLSSNGEELLLMKNNEMVTRNVKLLDLEEWEDYEEPKEYWYLDCYGMVLRSLYNGNEWDERRKLIGNYFETKEEAEKAAEKLKAWTRLKEKGFRFAYCEEVEGYDDMLRIMAYPGECDMGDVEELFGSEE